MGIVKFQSVPYSFSASKAIDIQRVDGKLPFSLTELTDVDTSSLENNQVLSWNGTNWVNKSVSGGGGAVSLNELTDVTILTPEANSALLWNGSNWSNSTLNLDILADVNSSSVAENEFLKFDGTNWTNSSISSNNISDFNISGQVAGQALVWDGTNWTNQAVTGSSVWTEDANSIFYNNSTKNVGIGTDAPTQTFQVNLTGDKGVLFTGEKVLNSNIGVIPAGSNLMFFPGAGIFRAGTVDGSQWSTPNVGEYSAAFGYNTTASKAYTFVAGRANSATASSATAFGHNNSAMGSASFVAGVGNKAIGINSLVVGVNNNSDNNIDGDNSFVTGENNNGYSSGSVTFGKNNKNLANNSLVFGEESSTGVNCIGGIAAGFNCSSNANYSVAFGLNNFAEAYASLVIGRYNKFSGNSLSWVDSDPIFVIGNGTSNSDRKNAFVVLKNGDVFGNGVYTISPDPGKSQKVNNYLNILKIDANFTKNKNKIKYSLDVNKVKKYFPELITDFNNGKAINYIEFIPLMLETVKDQQSTIENLQNENQELKDRLSDIEKRLSALEN